MNRLTNDMQDFGGTVEGMNQALDRFAHDPQVLLKGVMATLRVLIHNGHKDEAIQTLNRLQYYVTGDSQINSS